MPRTIIFTAGILCGGADASRGARTANLNSNGTGEGSEGVGLVA